MLYTFAYAHYDQALFARILQQLTPQDALLFWQDGVNFLLQNASIFTEIFPQVYVLEADVLARGLHPFFAEPSFQPIQQISLSELVDLSLTYYPQFAY